MHRRQIHRFLTWFFLNMFPRLHWNCGKGASATRVTFESGEVRLVWWKKKTKKILEFSSEICHFARYPNGIYGKLFYSFLGAKAFVIINATIIKNNYINEHQPKNIVVLEEMSGNNFTLTLGTQLVDIQLMMLGIPR